MENNQEQMEAVRMLDAIRAHRNNGVTGAQVSRASMEPVPMSHEDQENASGAIQQIEDEAQEIRCLLDSIDPENNDATDLQDQFDERRDLIEGGLADLADLLGLSRPGDAGYKAPAAK